MPRHPSKGPGWGGPAKGTPKRSPPHALFAGEAGPGRGNISDRTKLKRERVAKLEDHLYDLALGAERQDTQVQAAARLHAIYEGMPTARQEVKHSGGVSIDGRRVVEALKEMPPDELDAAARALRTAGLSLPGEGEAE